MKWHYGVLIGLLGLLALQHCQAVLAVGSGANPYQAIIDRNVFGLKTPVQTVDPATEGPKPVKVQLVGVASMLGKKTAIIKFIEPPKPGQPVPQEPLVLSEGEAMQEIEVVEIDETAGLVKILNRGTPLTLDIKEFESKAQAGQPAAPGPVAGGTPPPGPAPTGPRMATMPPQRPAGPAAPPVQPQPTPPAPQSLPTPSPSRGVSTAPTGPGGVSAVPAGRVGTGPTLAVAPTPAVPLRIIRTPEPPQIPYEEQVIMIELERERTRELFLRGEYPPLPPTELTPEEDLKLILAPPQPEPGPSPAK